MKDMPKYQCHKTVHAAKVDSVKFEYAALKPGRSIEPVFVLTFVDKGHKPTLVDMDFMYKHRPRPGGYYLRYPDGYESFSPGAAFENGYAPYNPYDFESVQGYAELQKQDEELWKCWPDLISDADDIRARVEHIKKLKQELRALHAVIDKAAGDGSPSPQPSPARGEGDCKDGRCAL